MEGIETKVKEIIAKVLNVPAGTLSEETAIGDIPAWDSLRHIQIIVAIEKEFGFKFTTDAMTDIEDVSDLVSAVEARVGR